MRSSSAVAAMTSGWDSGPAARSSGSRRYQRGREARRDLRAAAAAVDERACDRQRSGRVRARLKDGPGGDIGVHGSISVAQALLAGGLVDELRLVIAPSIAGAGRRLLDGLPSIQLESIRSEISPTGYL